MVFAFVVRQVDWAVLHRLRVHLDHDDDGLDDCDDDDGDDSILAKEKPSYRWRPQC